MLLSTQAAFREIKAAVKDVDADLIVQDAASI